MRLGESVDLVEKEHRGQVVEVSRHHRLVHHPTHITHPRIHGRELDELATRTARDRLRQGRLAGAGRAPEDHRDRTARTGGVGCERHQGRPRAEEMLLAGDLIERARTHPHRQRGRPWVRDEPGIHHPAIVISPLKFLRAAVASSPWQHRHYRRRNCVTWQECRARSP